MALKTGSPTASPVRVPTRTADDETPTGIALGIGSALVVAAVLVAAMIPPSETAWRFGVVAGAVGLFAAWSGDQLALLGVATIAWLLANGFLVDRLGELSWHGSSDIWRIVVLVAVGTVGLLVHAAYRQVHSLRQDAAIKAFVSDIYEEEKRDA